METITQTDPKKLLQVEVPYEFLKNLRRAAIDRDMSVKALVMEAITQFIKAA